MSIKCAFLVNGSYATVAAHAPRRIEVGHLQVGDLVVRRDPRIADFRGTFVALITGTDKPLIYLNCD